MEPIPKKRRQGLYSYNSLVWPVSYMLLYESVFENNFSQNIKYFCGTGIFGHALSLYTGTCLKGKRMNDYIMAGGKKLRYGYTTGSCAAAAAKAAALMLLGQKAVSEVMLMTPKGILLNLKPLDAHFSLSEAACAIKKDAGDDSDITNGILVYAKAEKFMDVEAERVVICAGDGIGRVTKPGLDQPAGAYAINSSPREQIKKAVISVMDCYDYDGQMQITLWIPEGRRLAEKTFNPNLGIEGGISIIGTSGIVEPMSERALLDSIRLEIHVKAAEGSRYLILTPGNYGQDFIREKLKIPLNRAVKCSNYIGDAFTFAWNEHFRGILLIGHIGKLIKVGAGVWNTHSRYGDRRMEELERCIQEAGYSEYKAAIKECITTEEALSVLEEYEICQEVMQMAALRIRQTLHRWKKEQGFDECRAADEEVIIFSKQHAITGMTDCAQNLLQKFRKKDADV